jgi:chromosome segregation protein
LKSLGEQVAEREQAHESQQAACYEVEQQLTEARQQLAECQVEAERTRGRLASQVKESGSIEQRIAQNEKESQDLGLRLDALDEEIAATGRMSRRWKRRSPPRGRMTEINQQREALQAKVRERERAIEGGRQVILRLLGEASTLKNQLAQIEEYLAGIDRETARATHARGDRWPPPKSSASTRPQAAFRDRGAAPDGTGIGHRRAPPHRAGPGRAAAWPPNCAARSTALKTEVSQIRARKESLEQVLAHRTYTTESVKRLFASLEKGKADDLKPLGVLADYVEVDPQFEKPAEEFLHEELEYVVVQNWQQAERGLDFIRAELDGRATFLVHPEPNGHGRSRLPEPAIGPETGISARLSDSLRLTNGFKDRAIDLLPRVSLCFLAEDRAAAQRLAVSYPHLYFLLPDGACYHGHTVTGGKKSGAGPLAMKREARELAVTLKARQAALDEMLARLDGLTQEIIGFEAELERCAPCSSRARRTAWRSITKCASWATIWRAPIRASAWRAWSWSACAATPKNRPISASATRRRGEEKERLRAESEEALEAERAELEKLEGQAATIGKSTPWSAPSWPASKSATAASAPPWAAWSSSSARPPTGATPSRPKSSAWANSARACWPTISSSTAKGALLAEQITTSKRRSTRWPRRTPAMREALRANEEELKGLRAAVQEMPGEALADRSRPGAQAGRAEVPRRNQPQGTGLPGGGTGRRRRSHPR